MIFIKITDHIKEIETYIINEKQKWLICLLFVIKNANRSLIRDWLKQEASERQVKFIHALSLCIETFEVNFFFFETKESMN